MLSLPRALRASQLLLKACLRGEGLGLALLAISLPLTISSIYAVGSAAIAEELSAVAALAPPQPAAGCVRVGVEHLQLGGGRHLTIYLTEDVDGFLRLYGCRATGRGAVLASAAALEELQGEPLRLAGGLELQVGGLVECRYMGGPFLVVNASAGPQLELCPDASAQRGVVEDFGEGLSGAVLLLSLLSLLPFAASLPLAVARIVGSLSRELRVLREQGLGLGELRASLAISLSTLTLASAAYGLASGVVLAHGALWALRLLGPPVLSRPLPPPPLLAPAALYVAYALLTSLAVSVGGRLEGGR